MNLEIANLFIKQYGSLNVFRTKNKGKLLWLLRLPTETDSEYLLRCIIHTKHCLHLKKTGTIVEESYKYPIEYKEFLYYPYFKVRKC